MPLPLAVRNLLKDLYDEAELSPDLQTSRRITFNGREYKLRVELANPDLPQGTVLIVLKPRPNDG